MVSLIPGATTRPEFSPFLKFCDNADFKQSKIKEEGYEAEGVREYREANRRIQKAVKKAKED